MKLRLVAVLGVAFSLMAGGVSSAGIVLNVSLLYEQSYDATFSNSTVLPSVVVPGGDSSLSQVSLSPGGQFVNHQFGMYVTVSGLSADQDVLSLQFNPAYSGSVALGNYTANSYMIDPGPMGSPSSDAPSAPWSFLNFFSGMSYIVDLQTGTSTGGAAGNTFGDYAAYMQLGESGSANAPGPFLVGRQIVTADGSGTFGFSFPLNPGYLKIVSGNTDGAALDSSYGSYPTSTGVGDTAMFAPRTATDLTWANGTATSATWSVADGNQHWVQTGSPAVRDDFYHLDTVRFTSNAAEDRTVTLAGTLNPTSVVVDSADNYVFTGSGRIVGQGTTLVKKGSGKLTINNTGANAYTGKTTLVAGTLELATAAQSTVLSLGGVDIQAGLLSLAYTTPGDNPAATVDALMKASYDGGAWDLGQFQSTTAAAAGLTLGWFDRGTTVDVKLAVPGDVNLDGVVNFDDYGLVVSNYGSTGSAALWGTGDVNYDGVVNFDDYGLVVSNYGQVLPPEYSGSSAAGVGSSIPEPGTLALLAAGLLGLIAYAWRNRR